MYIITVQEVQGINKLDHIKFYKCCQKNQCKKVLIESLTKNWQSLTNNNNKKTC